MSKENEKPVGLTQDVGWQVGARRTFNVNVDAAWDFLVSAQGTAVWLGEALPLPVEQYKLKDGTQGEMRVFKPKSHLRMTWQPEGWEKASTIQVRVIASGDKAVIAFHHENMPDEAVREKRKAHYLAAMAAIETALKKSSS